MALFSISASTLEYWFTLRSCLIFHHLFYAPNKFSIFSCALKHACVLRIWYIISIQPWDTLDLYLVFLPQSRVQRDDRAVGPMSVSSLSSFFVCVLNDTHIHADRHTERQSSLHGGKSPFWQSKTKWKKVIWLVMGWQLSQAVYLLSLYWFININKAPDKQGVGECSSPHNS